ncbi:MAG: hypothetical protein VX528_03755, partial [Candidatus Latescibacterota bacterium]|nr:hypothetical protein [Candidatus Latescibacterota bacterium]
PILSAIQPFALRSDLRVGGQDRAPSVPYLSIPCIGGCGGILQTFFVHSIESLKWRPEPLKRQPEPVRGKFPK